MPPPHPQSQLSSAAYVMVYRFTHDTFAPIVNGSTKLRKVNIAKVGREDGHPFEYLPGESKDTVWPGRYELSASRSLGHDLLPNALA